jgi:hypothetical protein
MRRRTRWILGGALAVAVLGGGATAALATAGDDDRPLTGATHDRAVAAALAVTGGGGTVTETEAGDDGAPYGVEVRLPDGRQVEVNLDAGFRVVGQEADEDRPGEAS